METAENFRLTEFERWLNDVKWYELCLTLNIMVGLLTLSIQLTSLIEVEFRFLCFGVELAFFSFE